MSGLHRKNAAEWVMFVVIYPFAWIKYKLTAKDTKNAKEKK
jgi:hypothetical protein